MRNKVLLIILLSGLLIIVISVLRNTGFFSPSVLPTPTPQEYHGNALDIKFKDQNLKASYFKVSKTDKISLHPNFEEKLVSSQILENENCKYLTNGGFYSSIQENTFDKNVNELNADISSSFLGRHDQINKPIGLFVTGNVKLSDRSNSSLFNGFVSLEGDDFSITEVSREASLALQTGPILIKDGYKRNLRLINDEFARRIAIGKTDKEEIYFFAIYNKDSQVSGPHLVDLPEIVFKVGEVLGITIVDAINLDGGSASAFCDGTDHLKELSPIGSYFCVN